MKKINNKAISSVFGTILLLTLFFLVLTTLVLALYKTNENHTLAVKTEQNRNQEKITLLKLETEINEATEYITTILLANEGAITSRIRALYTNNDYKLDPSEYTPINPTTYVRATENLTINLPTNTIPYDENAYLSIATELGTKTTQLQGLLKNPQNDPQETPKINFGPLLLDFEKFEHAKSDLDGDTQPWKPGWAIESDTGTVAFKITVTNVYHKNITLTKYTCFTTHPNEQGIHQRPWYIAPSKSADGNPNEVFIPVDAQVDLVYIWKTAGGNTPQIIYDTPCRAKVFLTFFGYFHEEIGTKPYGQTIPFEAIQVIPPRLEITANPQTIAAGSTMTSTITVTTRNIYGDPAPNQQVSLTTTHGTLSATTVTTNAQGTATATLSAQATPATATITATWEGMTKTTTVNIAAATLSLNANPNQLAAGIDMTSTITATLLLNGNPIPNEQVTFQATPDNLGTMQTSATTNSLGQATVTFTAGQTTGTVTITATALTATATATTTINIQQATLTLTANPQEITPTMTATVTAQVKFNNDPIAGQTVTFTVQPTELGTIQAQATTDSNGYATVEFLPASTTGTATITATWQDITQTITINIVEATVTVQANPDSITAGSTEQTIITATVLFNNQPIAGELVSFTTDMGTLTLTSALTDENGNAITYLSPQETLGTATITATWQGITGTTTVIILELVVEP